MTLSENVQKVIELSQRIVVEKSVIQTYEEIRRNTLTTEYNVEKRTMTSTVSSAGGGGTPMVAGSKPIHSSQTTTESAHRVTEQRKFHTSSSASEILNKKSSLMTPMEDDNKNDEDELELDDSVKELNRTTMMSTTSTTTNNSHNGNNGDSVSNVGASKYTREGFLEAMKNSYSLDSMLSTRASRAGEDIGSQGNILVHQPSPVVKPPPSEHDFKVIFNF